MTSRNGRAISKIVHKFRCAVYTRKSSQDGLEQELSSIEPQREAGEAYTKSQASEGWESLPDHDEGCGLTGGNMEQPAILHSFDMQTALAAFFAARVIDDVRDCPYVLDA